MINAVFHIVININKNNVSIRHENQEETLENEKSSEVLTIHNDSKLSNNKKIVMIHTLLTPLIIEIIARRSKINPENITIDNMHMLRLSDEEKEIYQHSNVFIHKLCVRYTDSKIVENLIAMEELLCLSREKGIILDFNIAIKTEDLNSWLKFNSEDMAVSINTTMKMLKEL